MSDSYRSDEFCMGWEKNLIVRSTDEAFDNGIKAEHERVKHCITLKKINGVTYAVIDMMQFEYPKKAELIKDAAEVTGIWDLTGGQDPVEYIRDMRGE